jgi:hypothetical protein
MSLTGRISVSGELDYFNSCCTRFWPYRSDGGFVIRRLEEHCVEARVFASSCHRLGPVLWALLMNTPTAAQSGQRDHRSANSPPLQLSEQGTLIGAGCVQRWRSLKVIWLVAGNSLLAIKVTRLVVGTSSAWRRGNPRSEWYIAKKWMTKYPNGIRLYLVFSL